MGVHHNFLYTQHKTYYISVYIHIHTYIHLCIKYSTKKRKGNYAEKEDGQLCMVRDIMLGLEAGAERRERRTATAGVVNVVGNQHQLSKIRLRKGPVGPLRLYADKIKSFLCHPFLSLTLHPKNNNPNTNTYHLLSANRVPGTLSMYYHLYFTDEKTEDQKRVSVVGPRSHSW